MALHYPVLIAAQPAARKRLQAILGPHAVTVGVQNVREALRVLDEERVGLILCTIAFDDSRMLEFLDTVKRRKRTAEIPFLCCRALPGVLSDRLLNTTRAACLQCGAADFVDIAKVDDVKAARVLKAAISASVPEG